MVHRRDIASLDKVRSPSVSDKERLKLLVADSSKESRVVDLCSISVIALHSRSRQYLVAVQV